jgi:pyruvate dehydrogenase E2 component (dihydrolipoamide acetyltransferase)
MGIYKQERFGIARKIVSNMTAESWETIPHAVCGYEVDVTEFLKEYKKLNEGCTDKSKKISINTVVMKIICEGLMAAPKMNCHLNFERKLVRGKLSYHDRVNVSMPAMLPDGRMMTVNLRHMENKSLVKMTEVINDTMRRMQNTNMDEAMFEVSMDNTIKGLKKGKILQAIYRLVGAKTGKHKVRTLKGEEKKQYYSIPVRDRLTKDDIEQGTVTISNLGSIHRNQKGMCFLLEIIPPQVTAIAVNAIQKKPTVVTDENGNDTIEVRQILPLTIAFDHKALDYGDIIPFMDRLDEIFENPSVIHDWKE